MGACGNANPPIVTLFVNANSVAGSINGSGNVCEGTAANSLKLTGFVGNIVRWQSATSPFSTWTDISNNISSYNPGVISQTTQYRALIQSGNCTPQTSSTATLTLQAKPSNSSAGSDQALCKLSTQITANNPTVGTGKWSIANSATGGIIANPDAASTSFSGLENTTYKLIWSITNGVCVANTDEVNITFNAPVGATASPNQSIKLGESVALAADGGTKYVWTPAGSLNNAIISNPTAKPIATTKYIVIVSNVQGCSDTASVTVLVDDNIEPKFPNTFTPNDDESNNVWIIENAQYWPNATLDIYNRWGQIVIRKKGGNNMNWDGRNSSGAEMEVGTYFYVFKKTNDSEGKASSVSLIR